MKPILISTDSWHYRFIRWHAQDKANNLGWYDYSSCEYIAVFLKTLGHFLFLWAVILAGTTLVASGPIVHLFYWAVYDMSFFKAFEADPQVWMILPRTSEFAWMLLIMGGIVSGVVFVGCKTALFIQEKLYDRQYKNNMKHVAKRSSTRELISTKLEKICRPIKIVDSRDNEPTESEHASN